MRIGKWDCDGIGIGMCHRSFMKFQYKIVVGETFDWKAWSFPSMYYEYVLYIYIYIDIYIYTYIYIYIYIYVCVLQISHGIVISPGKHIHLTWNNYEQLGC